MLGRRSARARADPGTRTTPRRNARASQACAGTPPTRIHRGFVALTSRPPIPPTGLVPAARSMNRIDPGSMPPCCLAPRSEGAGVDHLAAGLGGDPPPDRLGDGVLDEADRAVEQPHVHAAGMVRAGADPGLARRLVGVAAEDARPLIG